MSLSARRAWIEIMDDLEPSSARKVALRKESVDRNMLFWSLLVVAGSVALRKESVDRNCSFGLLGFDTVSSLSARRAWIEILISTRQVCLTCRRSPQGERG